MKLTDLIHTNDRKSISRLFLIAALSSTSLFSYAQQQQVSLTGNDITVKAAFKQIEQQTKLFVDYNIQDVNDTRIIKKLPKGSTVKEVLEQLLEGTNCTVTFSNGHIIIAKNVKTSSSTKQISGVVKDETGEPVIGANVVEKGTTNGTITDVDGKFVLNVPSRGTLLVSYIGYTPREIAVNDQSDLNIKLSEDMEALEEVVVVGYGTQKKVNLTGAVETVSSDVLENRPITSATNALQGNVSGLTVSSGSGQPGTFSTFKVRGSTSVNSDGALVIIDGMPGDINRVNPQDIESISVLKDAASSAIYGARAAEGVILITTRQGKSDKVKVEYSGNISFNKPTRLPKSNTGLAHALLSNTAFSNAGLAVQFPEDAIAAIKDPSVLAIPKGNDWIYTSDVDWISMMMDHSFQENHNLTISKASDRLNYLFSAGWLDQNGMFSEYGPDNYDRINLRSNINVDILKDKLSLDSKITFTNSSRAYHPQFGGENYNPDKGGWTIPYITFIQAGPNMPIYDPNGNYSRYRMQANPIQALREGGRGDNKQQNIEGIATLIYKPIKGLTIKAIGGAVIQNIQIKEWRREYGKYGPKGLNSMGAGQAGPNRINQRTATSQYLTSQLLAEYNVKWNQHELNVLGGWSTEQKHYEELSASRTNIVGNELPALGLGSTDGWTNAADETEWALLSGFMRLNYAYASKYLLEVNFRSDASSRFSSKHKWGVFPSASVGWRITEEAFMKEQTILTNLKLRASWGRMGNQNGLGLYDHIPQYIVKGYYPFQSGLGQWASVEKLPSESRTWETVEMKNIAVDMSFLDNRLSFTGEYFQKNNKDMLVDIEIPSVIGITVPTGNYGELEVKGWEISAGWNDKVKDFSYAVSFNLSDQKDKLVDYGVKYNGFVAGVEKKVQGYSLGSIFGYETDGYFTSPEEVKSSAVLNRSVVGVGDIKYIDQDGDGKISAPNDLKYLGTTMPRFVFGINLTADWRNFDIGMLFQGVGKRNYYLNREIMAPFSVTWGNFSYEMHNDYWTQDNPNAALPRHYAGSSHNYETSDHWVQNAAYIRMKNLQIGYTLNKKILSAIGLERVRIYFSGENMFEFSKLNKNFDPELSSIEGFAYPVMRNYSFGLNITL